MKKIIYLFLLTTIVAVSCNKSNEKRIQGTWKVTKVLQDGIDVSSVWTATPYKETYASDGTYSYSGQPKSSSSSGAGKYTWDSEAVLKRNGVSGQSSVTITIVSLDKSNMQFTFEDNGDIWNYTFVKE